MQTDPTPDTHPIDRAADGDPAYASRPLFRRLWGTYLRPHLWLMVLSFAVMSIEGSTLGLLSWMIQPLFDKVFASGGGDALVWVGLAILGLFLLRAATTIISRTLLALISVRIASHLQVDMLAHILKQAGSFFQRHSPGALMDRVQGDSAAVQGIWQTVVVGAGRDVVALIGLFAVAIGIDWRWTLATLVGAPLLIVPSVVLQRYLRRKATQIRDEAAARSTRLDEIFHGINAIKLNRQESHQTGRFVQVVERLNRAYRKSVVAAQTMPAMIDIVTGVGFFAVLMLGGREVAAGERTVGEFMSFFTAMTLTFQPIRRLGEISGQWQIAAASLERIFRLLDTDTGEPRPALGAPPPQGVPGIELRDVHFAYPGVPVLNGLTFTAEAGRMTAIVGPSGAGKSTVFHLLTALAEPDAGEIRIGGQDVRALTLSDQRSLFATVSQDTALFDETLQDNILMGRADIAPDRLRSVISAAHLDEVVATMPDGLATPAGPRGSALSGGQRQRVAIARALVADAPVLLLDEATSALDAKSEAAVAEALSSLAKGRTTLVIAHRLSTVREAHRIIVMDRGRVVEQGTHDELLAKGGLYAGLHALQFKD
ncbi:MAG: ABC transporter permease [Rhodobacter sp. CACIA14H1]|nr:MAG: ABC transporter permease [Rhodobacter sp. CACIA14H1]